MIIKIWNDSVWSKVIASIIFSGLTFYYTNYKFNIIRYIIPFIIQYYREIIIIILITALVITIVKLCSKNKKNNKPNIKWFKKYINSADFAAAHFLIWFPLNGVMRSPASSLAARNNLEILHSRRIKPLIDNNIIAFNFGGSVEISYKVYDLLDNLVKSNINKEDGEQINILTKVKNMEFYDLLYNCAMQTEYDDILNLEIR